jgi:hypothetical protein
VTREDAIKFLYHIADEEQSELEANRRIWTNQKRLEALSMAISAMREQEERGKGCEYCTATYIQHGSLVGFCPYCGRRLEEV